MSKALDALRNIKETKEIEMVGITPGDIYELELDIYHYFEDDIDIIEKALTHPTSDEVDEAFRKLGYKRTDLYNDNKKKYAYCYIRGFGNKFHEVRFWIRDKEVMCSKVFYDKKTMRAFRIDTNLQNAIHLKLRQLGWVE